MNEPSTVRGVAPPPDDRREQLGWHGRRREARLVSERRDVGVVVCDLVFGGERTIELYQTMLEQLSDVVVHPRLDTRRRSGRLHRHGAGGIEGEKAADCSIVAQDRGDVDVGAGQVRVAGQYGLGGLERAVPGSGLDERGAWANIKPMSNRKNVPAFSLFLYRYRNLVKRFFNKIKHYRRIFSRFEKLDKRLLGFLSFAAVLLWLR